MGKKSMRVRRCVVGLWLLGSSLYLAACTLSGGDWVVGDPVREAEATRVVLAARDESARRALERQLLQVQVEQAAHDRWSAVRLGQVLVATGIGVGVWVLVVGGALAWLKERVVAIYPDQAGLYPVIVRREWGGVTIIHDPNRALGPTTIYTAADSNRAPAVHEPGGGRESTRLQLATQAQAIALMAASTRPGAGESPAGRAEPRAQAPPGAATFSAPLPAVRVSQLEPAQVERLLGVVDDDEL